MSIEAVKITAFEEQPNEVKKFIGELGSQYVLLGGWLNDKDVDDMVEDWEHGRRDLLIGRRPDSRFHNTVTVWALLEPSGRWLFASKKAGNFIENIPMEERCLIDTIREKIASESIYASNVKSVEGAYLGGQPICFAQAELAKKLGKDSVLGLKITKALHSTSKVHGDDVLMRWGNKPEGRVGMFTVALDTSYRPCNQDVYEVKYSPKGGWQIPKDYIKEPKSHHRIGLYFGSATIDEVVNYLKPYFSGIAEKSSK